MDSRHFVAIRIRCCATRGVAHYEPSDLDRTVHFLRAYQSRLHARSSLVHWILIKRPAYRATQRVARQRISISLRSMELLKCTSTTADLTKLLSNCPVLESLVLISMKVSIGLKIRAPRLKMLIINGSFAYVQLEAPMLANAKILLRNSDTCCLGKNGGKSNLEEALGSLVHIEKLKMKEDFVKYLAKGCLPDHLPYMFNHLKKVSIKLNFHRFKEIRVACILFHNALNLQDLYILADPSTLTKEEDPSTFTSFWDTEASHGLVFNQLKTIFMEQYEACEPILAFVKLILGSAPLLEKMILRESTIYEEDENGNLTQITVDLDKSTKASTKAAIIFE
ncbi:F-box family protein [Rhynchospora pubera]|uniref:F-box family protein n=1 Tax=Rhynchospora pubera TaxID=906938 RepID=A0AAV8HKX5_9POAL|nr:F-box family protein [Rhynchospora pubera]